MCSILIFFKNIQYIDVNSRNEEATITVYEKERRCVSWSKESEESKIVLTKPWIQTNTLDTHLNGIFTNKGVSKLVFYVCRLVINMSKSFALVGPNITIKSTRIMRKQVF